MAYIKDTGKHLFNFFFPIGCFLSVAMICEVQLTASWDV